MTEIIVGWTHVDIDGTVHDFNWRAHIVKDDLAIIVDYNENGSVTIARVEQADDGRYLVKRNYSRFEIPHVDIDRIVSEMRAADNPLDLLIAALAV